MNRRNFLLSTTGLLLAPTIVRGQASAIGAAKSKAGKNIAQEPLIDTHVHLVEPNTPGNSELNLPANGEGLLRLGPFDKAKEPEGSQRVARAFMEQCKAAGVGEALCMPRMVGSDKDPLGIQDTLNMIALIRGLKLHPVGFANPERFDRDHIVRVEETLKQGQVKALKVYLGYLHYEPSFVGYLPYYRLAAKYNIPVIFHTGDTATRRAKLKYAHPLNIDSIAVDFPDTKFVIAHFGNPWIMDAAELALKNKNIWAGLSAFYVGTEKDFVDWEKRGDIVRDLERVRLAIDYTGVSEKFLYGSDWPLTPMKAYRDIVRRWFPEAEHHKVFHDNAKSLFNL